MYTCHLMVVRRALMNEIGGFRAGYEGAQDYDLLLRLMERTERIHHIPRVLYHWRKLPQSTASAGQAKPWALDAGRLAVEDYVRRNGIDAEVLPGRRAGLYRVRRRIRDRAAGVDRHSNRRPARATSTARRSICWPTPIRSVVAEDGL